MKTRKQKVICRVLCMVVSILLLASFFVVPVSAVDILTKFEIENIIYDYGGDPHDPDQRPYSSLHLISDFLEFRDLGFLNDVTWISDTLIGPFDIDIIPNSYIEFMFPDLESSDGFGDPTAYFGIYYINQLFDDNVLRTFSPGDTLFIDGSFFGAWTLDDSIISKGRFTLRNNGDNYDFSYGRVVAYTDTFELDINEDSEGFDYSRLAFHFSNEIVSGDLCLCFEFYANAPSYETTIGFEWTKFLVEFGPGVSPNYPIYPSAPGGDDIGNLDSQEQQLIQDSQVGLDAGVDVMQNTGSLISDLEANLNLVAFTGALNNVLNRLILIPGLSPLVNISLSLGLFASLFGLAASIISAASRGSGQAQREAQRESRKK